MYLILGTWQGDIKEGTPAFKAASSRLDEVRKRYLNQIVILENLLDQEPKMKSWMLQLLDEFRALPIGIQMFRNRFLERNETTFDWHLRQWRQQVDLHVTGAKRKRDSPSSKSTRDREP